MLITHAVHNQKKAETPKRKISRIVTAKNQLLNPSIKNLHKLNIDNKENQNPNTRKSPSPSHQNPIEQTFVSNPYQHQRDSRIKSQFYQTGVHTNPAAIKQSPMKKILFVKNLSYKSAKTSKNSSLDNKKQEHQESKYITVEGPHKEQNEKLNNQRRSYSHYNSNKSFTENESEIFVEYKLSEKPIQEFVSKEMFTQPNESQASYRMSPNEFHTKLTKFNENYNSESQSQQINKLNVQKLHNFDFSSSFNTESFHSKSIKMCPNIDSPGLSSLESFKNNRLLFQNKKQLGSNAVPLVLMDREKKESLSSKKRTSRIKINNKNSEKHRQSFNEENLTEESEIMVSSPSQPLFKENNSKLSNEKLNTDANSKNKTKSTNSKEKQEEQTLVETKKFDETFENLNSDLSKVSQSESIQCEIQKITLENPIQKLSVKQYCWNHPEKQAKYKLSKEVQRPYFCSKCTVEMVTKGFKVIEHLEQKTSRLEKLKSFMSEIETFEPKLKESQSKIISLRQKMSIMRSQAEKEIESYYSKLFKCLQNHKQTALKSLDYHSGRVLTELEQMRKRLELNEEEVRFLRNDILPNVELIVDELRINAMNWKKIIGEHEEKMREIERVTGMIDLVIHGEGEKKITMKWVEISNYDVKLALNSLEQTQIIFKQRALKVDAMTNVKKEGNRLHTSPTNLMNDTKRSFSFDEENIDNSFYIPSSKKKAQISPEGVENIYELTDSVRLSFGSRLQSNSGREVVQSPTFKAI